MTTITTIEGANSELTLRLRQQELATEFATFSLQSEELEPMLEEACRIAAKGTECSLAKVLEFLPQENCFLMRAGIGWQPGNVGHIRLGADLESPAGYAFQTGQPVLSNHLSAETRFRTPQLLVEHGVRRAFNVLVHTPAWRFGVLEVDSPDERDFTLSDTAFLQNLAATLAHAINAHRRIEELRQSRAFSQGVLDASPDCVKVLSSDGSVEFMNHRGLEMNELASLDEVQGKEFAAMWPAEQRAPIRDAIRRAAAGTPSIIEGCCPTVSEKSRWWELRFVPFPPHDSEPDRVIGISRDVSARHEADHSQRRSEAELRDLTETLEQRVEERTRERDRAWRLAQDLLAVMGTDGTIISVNAAWTTLLGWADHELIGRRITDVTHPDELDAATSAFIGMFERPLTQAFENQILHRDGGYRWFAWTGAFEDGHVYVAGRDVTLDREREAILRDTQDFSRLALSAVGGVGVWTYEVGDDLFFYDAAIADLYGIDPARGSTGLPRPEFLGNVHPDDWTALKATMAGGLVDAGDLELEYRLSHADGRIRWVLSRGHTYHDEAGRPVRRTGVGVETTKWRETEAALRQSQKMEAVGQLTGGLAHDFNNLLTGVTGSLELLQTRIAQGRIRDVDRYVVAAQGAAKRAAALTHRLLAFSRQQALDPKPTDVNRLVTGMTELIGRTVGPEITLEPLVAAGGLWSTLVDPGQLENALLNLCINARDAMPDGGKITIETGNKWLDERAARERELPPGQYVSLCVSDTGTGMPPQVIARAFDPFFTTKPIGKGTGLGLSMIYGFVKQSGGQVRIYSEMGQGTAVCLYLPRHFGAEDMIDRPPELSDAPRARQGETVLVVDDEPTVRMLVTEVLEDLGYRALEAANGAAGVQVLLSDERIDLLVTDVGLPGGMNGRQVADAARTLRPDLNVLFITGYAENAALSHGHLDPGMHVLTKPFAVEVLASRIRELINGSA